MVLLQLITIYLPTLTWLTSQIGNITQLGGFFNGENSSNSVDAYVYEFNYIGKPTVVMVWVIQSFTSCVNLRGTKNQKLLILGRMKKHTFFQKHTFFLDLGLILTEAVKREASFQLRAAL